eukprot:scaffold52321_cov37-Attheya_sp.AAC.3
MSMHFITSRVTLNEFNLIVPGIWGKACSNLNWTHHLQNCGAPPSRISDQYDKRDTLSMLDYYTRRYRIN